MTTSNSDTIRGLPTLDPGLVRRRRGTVVESALQLLDLRGGPTEPIGVRAVGVDVPDDPEHPLRRPAGTALEATARLDPVTGEPDCESRHAWACAIDRDAAQDVEAVRRFARGREGVNRRSALERRGWEPGCLLARRQIFPLAPPHFVWLDGAAWSADEVCCATPTCPCEDLHIDFQELRASGTAGSTLSAAIDMSRWEVTKIWGRGPAPELAMSWLAQPAARDRGRGLFASAHAAGEELLDPFVARRGVVHANSRCPCGGRKKYKRCCGRARPAPVPGDLHALKARARQALIDFATEVLGEALTPADAHSADNPVVIPSEESRWAWQLYWRRFDGFTLADRFLAEPDRGDPWLRRWLEAASGTPPDVFEVLSTDGRTARLSGLANLEGADHRVRLSEPGEVRVGEVVLASPVRLMGRTVLEGAWKMPSNEDIGPTLSIELKTVRDELDRLRRPERVLQAMFDGAAHVAAL